MIHYVKNLAKRRSRKRRRDKVKIPPDLDAQTAATIERVQPFTQTSPERIASFCNAVKYVVANEIPGDIVECGVWRGGSMMAAAITLQHVNADDRQLYLYDTYEGMTPPDDHDVALDGTRAETMLRQQSREDAHSVWCVSQLDEVRGNLQQTSYEESCLHFIKGRVEDTIPATVPERIAILRLDTDWYASTRHELVHLFPRITPGGVLIIDDYGHWEGARKAVDEYIETHRIPLLLNRIDYTGRIAVVPGKI